MTARWKWLICLLVLLVHPAPVVGSARAQGEAPVPPGRVVYAGLVEEPEDFPQGPGHGPSEIFSMRPDGSDVVRLTHDTWLNGTPAWSPDGALIAYAEGDNAPNGGPSELIHLMKADGSDQRLLVPGGWMDVFEMRWATMAPHVVASGWAVSGGPEVRDHFLGGDRVKIDRKGVEHVGDEPGEHEMVGRLWPWTSVTAPFEIMKRRAPGEGFVASNIWMAEWVGRHRIRRVRLTDNENVFDRAPVLSPDGELIAFERRGSGGGVVGSRIMTMRVDGSDVRDLTGGFGPRWSSDGKRILYSAWPEGCEANCVNQIGIVDRDGANARVIAAGYDPDWSPVCTIRGTADDDVIRGTDERDFICGGGGDDRIIGGDGNDTLMGGGGTDRLLGESGDDTLMGGDGYDKLDGGSGRDSLGAAQPGWGADQVKGGTDVDLCYFSTSRRLRRFPFCEAVVSVMPN